MKAIPPRTAVAGGALVLAAGLVWWAVARPAASVPTVPPAHPGPDLDAPPPDPRLTFETPFRNVRPDVPYVGDAGCAACHPDVCASYRAHPMGRSAERVARAAPVERYDDTAVSAGPFELRAVRGAAGVVHRVRAGDPGGRAGPPYEVSADVAIGSGTRGRSYLTLDRGAVWQSPLSWFADGARWDVSPGFDLGTGGRRPVLPDCLFCHTDRVEPVPGAVNRYREPLFPLQAAIGCERCHGPGGLHAAERAAGRAAGVDTSIVNPRHLPPALQSAVCEQCHLQGQERVPRRGRTAAEFRPGLPFDRFVAVFVRHPDLADPGRSVGQFEQVEQSRCAPAGGGRLLCTACHDPHTVPAPAARERFYRDRCNTCHASAPCTAPAPDRAARGDSCVACHMPRGGSTSIVHASVTDHRILRRPGPPAARRPLPPGVAPLVPFRGAAPGPDVDRDLGVALARAASRLPPGPARAGVGRMARDRLTDSLAVWRGDAESWAAMGLARAACGEDDERLAAATRALELAPGHESALAQVADAALSLGQPGRAEEAASALVALNPGSVDYLLTRASALAAQGRWDRAEADCRAALTIHPLHPHGRLMLGVCLHKRGDAAAGRMEADTAVGLATSQRQQALLREWYQRDTR